jgi:OOP family OmpA-OmpF porin
MFGALAAMTVAAPLKADFIFDTTSGLGLEADGIAFMNGLYDGYVALRDDREGAVDSVDSEHFNHKARRAARRSSVMPDFVEDRRLSDQDKPVFQAAWKRIRDAWDRGGRSLAPADAAEAQVSYDCWIEAAEGANPRHGSGGGESYRQDDIAHCKAAFEDAMAAVERAATLQLTEGKRMVAPAPMPMAAAPAPEAPKPFIIFFGFASADVTAAGTRVIDDAIATAERLGIVDFTITGHADRAGPEDFNLQLSLQRANAVRDVLVERGVKSSGISVAGRGEAENAVATADGVREQANRRVEIILL